MTASTLFISNFPFATTEDALRACFEERTAVCSVRIIVDRETGRSRGFAFVEIEDPAAIDALIEELNNSEFGGRRLAVSRARGRAAGADPSHGGPGPARSAAAGARPSGVQPPLRHRIVVEWDEAAGGYAAIVAALGITARGATPEKAVREACERARRHADEAREVDADEAGE